ncbi:hypothetical protein CEXT_132751 [Caerostris extrusa]|uniref:Uncharacterized protein n=1 Tax=Caerostris extrusa TaxID=172846 RepID=A0AAV4VMI2_CAEEX|nr:hypothetical protein CEXT_132751 [Caerostris extrusa]
MAAVLYSPFRTEFPSLIYSYPEGGPLCPDAECMGCRINNECPDPVHRERYVWSALFVNSGLYSPKRNRRIMTAVLYSPIRTEFPSLIYSYPEGAPLCPDAECTGCRINNECPDPVHWERYVWSAVRLLMIRRTLASRVAT